jgi:hypothetical protein
VLKTTDIANTVITIFIICIYSFAMTGVSFFFLQIWLNGLFPKQVFFFI